MWLTVTTPRLSSKRWKNVFRSPSIVALLQWRKSVVKLAWSVVGVLKLIWPWKCWNFWILQNGRWLHCTLSSLDKAGHSIPVCHKPMHPLWLPVKLLRHSYWQVRCVAHSGFPRSWWDSFFPTKNLDTSWTCDRQPLFQDQVLKEMEKWCSVLEESVKISVWSVTRVLTLICLWSAGTLGLSRTDDGCIASGFPDMTCDTITVCH